MNFWIFKTNFKSCFKISAAACALAAALTCGAAFCAQDEAVQSAPKAAAVVESLPALLADTTRFELKRNSKLCAEPGGKAVEDLYKKSTLLAQAKAVKDAKGGKWHKVYLVRMDEADADAYASTEGYVQERDVKKGRMSGIEKDIVANRLLGLLRSYDGIDFPLKEDVLLWPRTHHSFDGEPTVKVGAGTVVRLWGMPLRTGDGTWLVNLYEPSGDYMLKLGFIRAADLKRLDMGDKTAAALEWLKKYTGG